MCVCVCVCVWEGREEASVCDYIGMYVCTRVIYWESLDEPDGVCSHTSTYRKYFLTCQCWCSRLINIAG